MTGDDISNLGAVRRIGSVGWLRAAAVASLALLAAALIWLPAGANDPTFTVSPSEVNLTIGESTSFRVSWDKAPKELSWISMAIAEEGIGKLHVDIGGKADNDQATIMVMANATRKHVDFNLVAPFKFANDGSSFNIILDSGGVSGSEFANRALDTTLEVNLKAPPYMWGANLFGYLRYSTSANGPFTRDGVDLSKGTSVYTRFTVGTDIKVTISDGASARPAFYWKRPPTDKADPREPNVVKDAQYDMVELADELESGDCHHTRTTVAGRKFGTTTFMCRYDVTQADLDASPYVLGLYMNGWQVISDYSGKALQPRGLYGWALPKKKLEYKNFTVTPSNLKLSIPQGGSKSFTVQLPSDATRRDTVAVTLKPNDAPASLGGGSGAPLYGNNMGAGETKTWQVSVNADAAVNSTFKVRVYRLRAAPVIDPTDYTYTASEITVTVTAAPEPPTLDQADELSDLTDGKTVEIRSVISGSTACLDVQHAAAKNGQNVWTWECNQTVAQRWTLKKVGTNVGEYQLISKVGVGTSYCLDNRGDYHDGGRVGIWSCLADDSAYWWSNQVVIIEPDGDKTFTLAWNRTGETKTKLYTDRSAGNKRGSAEQVLDSNDANGDKWEIHIVSSGG